MERLDVFYKAFEQFRSTIEEDSETLRFRKFCSTLKSSKHENLKVLYSEVIIDNEWVDALEKGLVYVEKAIKEERQFIRNDGEVVPIEKVRRTSKAGIQDLARHSNYITHESYEGAATDVIPDKMLMVQRESDYAIYENRVVYALLAYLKDFVGVRLEKIKKMSNSFEFESFSDKEIDFGGKKISYKLNIHEIRENDPTMTVKSKSREIIDRLDKCSSLIMAFLKTPLMLDVAKAELVSRPITKTNVLRMNTNFRESLKLFDYIAEYQGEGFEVKKIEKSFNPFSQDHQYAMTDILELTSFATYIYGNNLTQELKENLKKAKEEEAIREQERILKKLHAFEDKGKANMQTIEEYFESFVEGYKILEKKFEESEQEKVQMKNDFDKQINKQKIEFDEKIVAINEEHEKTLNEEKEKFEKIISEKDVEFTSRIETLNEDHRLEINSMTERFDKEVKAPLENKIKELETSCKDKEKLNAELTLQNEELSSRLLSIKVITKKANNPNTYASKETFEQLEKMKKAFNDYYKRAWAEAKKQIRQKTIKVDKDYKKHAKEAKELKAKEQEAIKENEDESRS